MTAFASAVPVEACLAGARPVTRLARTTGTADGEAVHLTVRGSDAEGLSGGTREEAGHPCPDRVSSTPATPTT